jgi:uncharacterized protein (TIGR03067 family)
MYPAATCLATFALFLPTKEPAEAPAELQGTWKLIAVENGGKSNDLAEPAPRVVIRGSKLHYGGAAVAEIGADAGAAPKVIDLSFTSSKRVLEGIYAIERYAENLSEQADRRGEGAAGRLRDKRSRISADAHIQARHGRPDGRPARLRRDAT